MKRIYLDANGSCPAIKQAIEAAIESFNYFGNPSSFHEHGRTQKHKIDEARSYVANALEVGDNEIIFTSGASEANRLFIDALAEKARQEKKILKICISPFEHPSLLKPFLHKNYLEYFALEFISLSETGELKFDFEQLRSADVVVCTYAHNESGILTNLEKISENISDETILMSDISQAFSRVKPKLDRVDVITCSAQKMGGLAGAGAIVFRGNAKELPSPWPGGGQEKGFRPGTEASSLIQAFGAAAKHIDQSRKNNFHLAELRDFLQREIKKHFRAKIIGENISRIPNTLAASFYDQNPDALRIGCDLAGLSVGFGAACSGLAPEGSFALKKMGLSPQEEKTTVRFSLSHLNTQEEISECVKRLQEQIIL